MNINIKAPNKKYGIHHNCTHHQHLQAPAFKNHEVVPDLLDVAPLKMLKVVFPKNNIEVELGNKLAAKDIQDIPEITYDSYPDIYYTLVLTDPDAPRRKNPSQKEWIYWMVVNIPGSKINNGEILTEYVEPCPPMYTDFHRNVFLLYEQPDKLNFDEPHRNNTNVASRTNFSVKKFAKKYNLGDPIAGNFYQVEYDDSVPAVLRKMMSTRN